MLAAGSAAVKECQDRKLQGSRPTRGATCAPAVMAGCKNKQSCCPALADPLSAQVLWSSSWGYVAPGAGPLQYLTNQPTPIVPPKAHVTSLAPSHRRAEKQRWERAGDKWPAFLPKL